MTSGLTATSTTNDIDSLTDGWRFLTPEISCHWLSDVTFRALSSERMNRDAGYKPGLLWIIAPSPARRIDIMHRVLLAASLTALTTLASAQILAPVNGNNYTIYNAHNNRCANLIGSDTNEYVPVIMAACNGLTNQLWTAHVNPTDATLVSFSSAAVPGSWLSYSTAEIAGGPDSMHQLTIALYTPYDWYIGASPL
ncbi:hypothetical protein B0H19DRAFT_1265706 [Mycena capillaripes]|nr:hypothetical protein B0H19DRAFT_1265706 [Mycena capillaripes]